jgi:hypothetical protein
LNAISFFLLAITNHIDEDTVFGETSSFGLKNMPINLSRSIESICISTIYPLLGPNANGSVYLTFITIFGGIPSNMA